MQAHRNSIVGVLFLALFTGGCVHFQTVDGKTGDPVSGVHVERIRQYVWQQPPMTLPIALSPTDAKGKTASMTETRLFNYLFTFSKPGYAKMQVWIARDDTEARVFPANRAEVADPDVYPIRINLDQLIRVPMVPKVPTPDSAAGVTPTVSPSPS
ncbi:MAG: hypothetical protein JWO87_1354 [Phycisphaerales bacterium]|jgi:hypothetical protein|nr:hypothetical protein [Phycisphaerales bacterium]